MNYDKHVEIAVSRNIFYLQVSIQMSNNYVLSYFVSFI